MKPTIATITDKWIDDNKPCQEALDWWSKKELDVIKTLKLLIKAKKYVWANWFIVRVMEKHDYVSYAIYAAEQVIGIYEGKYPDDKRPRQAIEATLKYIKNPTGKNNSAAASAASAAYSAADSAADSAAYSAASAAYSAAYSAASAAYSSASAADSAAYSAAYSAASAMRLKILTYGMRLLKGGVK